MFYTNQESMAHHSSQSTPRGKRPRYANPYETPEASDQSSDVECSKKDSQIKRYKDKLGRYDQMIKEYVAILAKKDEELEGLYRDKEDFQKKSKGIASYTNEMHTKCKLLEDKLKAEKIKSDKTAEVYNKQLKDLQNTNESLKDQNSETVKRMESNARKLEADITSLRVKLEDKQTEVPDIDQSEEIERLRNECTAKSINLHKYKNKYEKLRTEFEPMKIDFKKLKAENESLKRQRKYFQDHNENNKLKALSTSCAAIKQKEVDRNAIQKIGIKAIEVEEEAINKIIEFILKVKGQTKRNFIQHMANVITETKESHRQIEATEKRMLTRRADGKVLCPYCDRTFESTGDMKHHLTVTHKINTTDPGKNLIHVEPITFEDDCIDLTHD